MLVDGYGKGVTVLAKLVLIILFVVGSQATLGLASDAETDLSNPAAAYDALASVVESNDLDGFKALMSSKLAKRLSNEFYIAEGLRSGAEYLEKVPKGEPETGEGTAAFSKTYDEASVVATYSIQFVDEDGRWKFDGYKTSTKSK